MPETTFETEAIWFSPGPEHLDGLEQMPKLLGTLHAAEHTLIALLPLWAMCDRWDIGGLSTNLHYQTGQPDDLRLRRPRGRRRHHRARLRALRGLGRGHRPPAGRLPVRERLPVVRPEPEVREPQRAARQGGRARAPRAHARPDRCRFRGPPLVVVMESKARERRRSEVHGTDLRRPERVGGVLASGERGCVRAVPRIRRRGTGGRRPRRRRRARLDARRDDCPRSRGGDARHGRPVRRGEGGARRLLPARVRLDGRRARLGRADPRRRARRRRGAPVYVDPAEVQL